MLALNPQPISFGTIGSANTMLVPRDQAMQLMRTYVILHTAFAEDKLGLYTLKSVGNTGELSFMSFTPPKHVFQPRVNGCAWRPKGKIGSKQTKFTLDAIEYDGEQCPDGFWQKNWERIFGVGTDITKLAATPEGRALADEIVRLIYIGLGNSYHDLVDCGQHPLIDDADANGWYTVSASEWADYKDQQQTTTGHLTIIDRLKTDGIDHYNVDITSFYDTNTGAFTGDAFDFLDKIIGARTRPFKIQERNSLIKGIIRLDEVSYQAYSDQLVNTYQNIPDTRALFINGVNGKESLAGGLSYKGYAIIPETSWGTMDEICGVTTRRAVLSYQGVFGIGYDVPSLSDQYNGMGLIVQESPLMREKGRLDMWTTLKTGQLILDTDFVVNGSFTLTPQ